MAWRAANQVANASELLINPGFESGTSPWRLTKGSRAALAQDARTGRHPFPTGKMVGGSRPVHRVTLEIGATYEFRGHLRWLDSGERDLRFLPASAMPGDATAAPTDAATLPSPWTAFAITSIATRSRERIGIHRGGHSGGVLLDDLGLKMVKPAPAGGAAAAPPADAARRPVSDD